MPWSSYMENHTHHELVSLDNGCIYENKWGDDHSLHRNIIQVLKGIDQWPMAHILMFIVVVPRNLTPGGKLRQTWEVLEDWLTIKFVVFLMDPLQDRAHSSDT